MKIKTFLIGILSIVCGIQLWYLFGAKASSAHGQTCLTVDQDKQSRCWRDSVDKLLADKGVDGAFAFVVELYDTEPGFGDTCHDLTHQIGAAAYSLFARQKKFTVSAKTAYCSYGFYHGFMEALVSKGGDMKVARDFCQYIDEALAKVAPDATLQCFHGIGHGTVNNHDPATWGSEQAMIDPALSLCEQVATTWDEKSRCATGVFNGIASFYNEGQYKLTLRREDPLWICRQQKEDYQDACYISLNITLLSLNNGDLGKAARFVEAIPQDSYAEHAMINLAAPVGTRNLDRDSHEDILGVCRSVQSRLRLPCIQGYAYGFLEHGQPEEEYKKPLEFCKSSMLTTDEQNACFEYIFSYLPRWYSRDKAAHICTMVPPQFMPLCREKTSEVL